MALQSQQVRAFEMLRDSAKLSFKDVLIFTVTNNVISMPISPPKFTKGLFSTKASFLSVSPDSRVFLAPFHEEV